MKYVAVLMRYYGCPSHDGESFSRLEFFADEDTLIQFALENSSNYKVDSVYDLTTYQPVDWYVNYKYLRHSIEFIEFKDAVTSQTRKRYKPHEYAVGKWQLMEEI